ncbi:uncharacterized protein RSE6_02141 [Rhynchosporium secalis]|uniref:non-specific serine/threonine protein kinase n=1 Tax=Rhynchosporium secalis TaxID=38038 RepID=A0A1E1LZK1_RHYSE|nr:uncharacterized protein RSE6_02141 [Rhynchosporium secalis]
MPDRRFTSVTPSDAIEEELLPHYNARHFYPVEPGKVFREKYETVAKLGYARSRKNLVNHNLTWCSNFAPATIAIKRLLNTSCRSNVIEGFEVLGPNGMHMCLVFEPMRETLSLFQSRLKQKRFPLKLLKMYLICLLTGLDYLHSECHIIHTGKWTTLQGGPTTGSDSPLRLDLSLQNILVNFEDDSVLDEFAQAQIENPMLQKERDGYSIYQSHNQFGQLRIRLGPIVPKVADFGHAQWITESEPQINPIQPDYYRAPEVILGIGWSYSADIWNLGVLLWTMLEGTGKNLFHDIHSSNGHYMAQNHLAQMIALLGLPPAELVAREIEMRRWNFAPAIEDDEAKLCHKAYQFYKGPFFDDNEGTFLYPELVPPKLGLEGTISSLEDEEKRAFLDFVANHMLC